MFWKNDGRPFIAACISTRAFSNIPQKQLLFKSKSD